MQDGCRNIYQTARRTAGVTQERWAEMLGISVEAVRLYETDRNLPGDEIVLRMAELALLPPLAYWHLRHKSTVAAQLLPPIRRTPLSQAAIRLLLALNAWTDNWNTEQLLEIAQDGQIDEDETVDWIRIKRDLDAIVQAALEVKFSEQEE